MRGSGPERRGRKTDLPVLWGQIQTEVRISISLGEAVIAVGGKGRFALGFPGLILISGYLEGNDSTYEATLQGSGIFQRFWREDTYRSRAFFERAMALDPAYARPVGMLAWTCIFEYNNGWSVTLDKTLTRALELANQAVSLDASLAVAYFVRGLVYRERKAYLAALAEAQAALDLDPNYANAHILLATILYYSGHAEEGLRLARRASRLDPQHPSNYPFHEGQALFVLKRYPEAIDAFRDGLRQNPTSERLRMWLAAAYARAGLEGEADWEVPQVLADDPDFSLQRVAGIFPFQDPAELQHFLAALEAAGFE